MTLSTTSESATCNHAYRLAWLINGLSLYRCQRCNDELCQDEKA